MYILECIDDKESNDYIKKGNIYIATRHYLDYYELDLRYNGCPKKSLNGGYFQSRFKVIKKISNNNPLVELIYGGID
jgi:hypothetical protein